MDKNLKNFKDEKYDSDFNVADIVENDINIRYIFKNLHEIIFIIDNDKRILFTNEQIISEKLGYTLNELIGKNILELIHKEDIHYITSFLNEKDTNYITNAEVRFENKKNSSIWFEVNGEKYQDKEENPQYLFILRNITDRKIIEVKYKNLFESSPNGIILLNFSGIIIDINATTIQLFGNDKNYYINRPIQTIENIYPPEIKPFFKKIFASSFEGKFPDPIEAKVLKNDGSIMWALIQSSLVKVKDYLLIQLIYQDISEKKRIELLERGFKKELKNQVLKRTQELNDALKEQKSFFDQIVRSSQFKTEFMATMSHELRTPLNAIIGFTDLLLEGLYGDINEDQLELLSDIKTSAEYQFEMIKKILDISKIESGKLTLHYEKFSIKDIIDQVIGSFKQEIENKDLNITMNGIESEKMIYADLLRFKEIFYNLMSNAVKFTENGEIIVEFKENNKEWIFHISDTGIGIEKKDFELIFKEFKRVNSDIVRSIPGVGLGLSLAKRLINLHGGTIIVSSSIDIGSTFIFTIPKKIDSNQ